MNSFDSVIKSMMGETGKPALSTEPRRNSILSSRSCWRGGQPFVPFQRLQGFGGRAAGFS